MFYDIFLFIHTISLDVPWCIMWCSCSITIMLHNMFSIIYIVHVTCSMIYLGLFEEYSCDVIFTFLYNASFYYFFLIVFFVFYFFVFHLSDSFFCYIFIAFVIHLFIFLFIFIFTIINYLLFPFFDFIFYFLYLQDTCDVLWCILGCSHSTNIIFHGNLYAFI